MMNKTKRDNLISGYLFIAPPIVGFICFGLIPILFSLYVSFCEFNFFTKEISWLGGENFVTAFEDPIFHQALKNMLFMLLEMTCTMIAALAVALLVCVNLKGQSVIRACFYLPGLCSSVAVTMVWKSLYNYDFGILNGFLTSLGLHKVPWLNSADTVMWSMLIQGVWFGVGGGMVMYIAALKNVPSDFYEAAKIDGASVFRVFFNITFPLITPTTFYLLVTGIIGNCQEFTRFQLMTDGRPGTASMVPVLYVYQTAFTNDYGYNYTYATCMSWIVGAIIILLVGISFKTSKYWVEYGD